MRLLLVEDDTELAKYLIKDLSGHGFAVDHADNGIDAEYMGELEPYDAVILDLWFTQAVPDWKCSKTGDKRKIGCLSLS